MASISVNFKTLITDLDDEVMVEPVVNKRTNEVEWEEVETPFTTTEHAARLGIRDAFVKGDKVMRLLPKLDQVTLQRICKHALVRKWEGEDLTHEQMFDRWSLARRITEELDDNGCLTLDQQEREQIADATDNYTEMNRIYFARCRELLGVDKNRPVPKKKAPPQPNGMTPGMPPMH